MVIWYYGYCHGHHWHYHQVVLFPSIHFTFILPPSYRDLNANSETALAFYFMVHSHWLWVVLALEAKNDIPAMVWGSQHSISSHSSLIYFSPESQWSGRQRTSSERLIRQFLSTSCPVQMLFPFFSHFSLNRDTSRQKGYTPLSQEERCKQMIPGKLVLRVTVLIVSPTQQTIKRNIEYSFWNINRRKAF